MNLNTVVFVHVHGFVVRCEFKSLHPVQPFTLSESEVIKAACQLVIDRVES